MTSEELESAELQLAKLRANSASQRQNIAHWTAVQEATDFMISKITIDLINARIDFERNK